MATQDKTLVETEGMVACELCLKEIPLSEAKNAEADDYVRHFCGLDCYQEWSRKLKPPVTTVKNKV